MRNERLQPVTAPLRTPDALDRRIVHEVESLMPGQAQDTLRALQFQAEHEARAHLHVRKKDRRPGR